MSWTHVSNSGAQATSGSQTSLSATFPSTIAAGDLIVVSVAFFGPYAPLFKTPQILPLIYILAHFLGQPSRSERGIT